MGNEKQILENAKIMLGTPMLSGQCNGNFTGACINLFKLCERHSIIIDYNFKLGQSLLPLARNELVYDFMQLDYTHLLMIDADTDFDASDILKLILFDKDVIGAPIAKKGINWSGVEKAIKNNKINNPEDAIYFGNEVNFVPLQDEGTNADTQRGEVKLEHAEPLRVSSVGTGLILIKRHVFERMREEYPELEYRILTKQGAYQDMFSYFELTRKKDGAMMAEDVSFCHRVNEMGMETWIYPWMKTVHHGSYEFPIDFSKNI